jgi:hypothetical protein
MATAAGQLLLSGGRGCVSSPKVLDSKEFRYYTLSGVGLHPAAGEIRYFPAHLTLLRWATDPHKGFGDATVILKRKDETWSGAGTFSARIERSESGTFVRFVLAEGIWDVALLEPGFGPIFHVGVSVRGSAMDLPRLSALPAGRVHGRVRNARSGKAPPEWRGYLRSSARARNDSPAAALFADWPVAADSEDLDFASVPPGAWDLHIQVPGHRGADRAGLSVRAGQTVEVGDLFVGGTGAIEAHLTFPKRLPGGKLVASLWPSGSRRRGAPPLATRQVDPRSEIDLEFPNISPGQVALSLATAPPSGFWGHVDVAVLADQVAEIREEFSPVKVYGEIWKNDEPVEGAKVNIFQKAGESAGTTSNAAGEYELFVWSPGTYGLRVFPPDAARFDERIEISPSIAEFPHDVSLPSASLSGTVVDADSGAPISGATVGIQSSPMKDGTMVGRSAQSESTSSGADGGFRFDGLRDGPFDLDAQAEGYAEKALRGVAPGESGTGIVIAMTKGTGLKGRVEDPEGRPIQRAWVGLDLDLTGRQPNDSRMTAEDGTFAFEGLSAGSHAIYAHVCGYAVGTAVVDVRRSDEVQVITLPPATSRIHVNFVDQGGQPVALGGVSYVIGGVRVPNMAVGRYIGECIGAGSSSGYDADFFPSGAILMLGPNGARLGSFTNDGSSEQWRVVVPAAEPQSP